MRKFVFSDCYGVDARIHGKYFEGRITPHVLLQKSFSQKREAGEHAESEDAKRGVAAHGSDNPESKSRKQISSFLISISSLTCVSLYRFSQLSLSLSSLDCTVRMRVDMVEAFLSSFQLLST
ncbi:hypothetical protein KP509_11G054600 [Ceratopteris richardii]|uniref:Uncharacterized protein n=1 Tax=Ceratopteris richardii TaxID=49495 RepID=A0A8T2TPL0_CERRI|nr:hypothetical protein KP509_11G054600 [Ceratopteris richardii]